MQKTKNRSEILSCCDGLNVDMSIGESSIQFECVKCGRNMSGSEYSGMAVEWKNQGDVAEARTKDKKDGKKHRPKSTLRNEQAPPDVSIKHLNGR